MSRSPGKVCVIDVSDADSADLRAGAGDDDARRRHRGGVGQRSVGRRVRDRRSPDGGRRGSVRSSMRPARERAAVHRRVVGYSSVQTPCGILAVERGERLFDHRGCERHEVGRDGVRHELRSRQVFAAYGTWFPGSALSSQSVPLKTLSFAPPLSEVIVTTVPAGDVSVMSRSALLVWVMVVVRRSEMRNGSLAAGTVIVEVTTAGPVGDRLGPSVLAVAR